MNFLPIVLREMRQAARKPFLFRVRWCVGAAGFVTLLMVIGFGSRNPLSQGQDMLFSVGTVAFILCLLAGLFLTADCVSEEKREGTLGLLFLTDLRGYDVVLGKMAAQAAWSFLALLALLPVMMIPLLTGGVTWGQAARIMTVLILTLFLSLSCGMAVSSLVVEAKTAFIATFTLLIVIVGLPMLAILLTEIFGGRVPPVPSNLFFHFSPVFTMVMAIEYSRFGDAPIAFLISGSLVGGVSIMLLVLAAWKTRSSWGAFAEVRTVDVKSRIRPMKRSGLASVLSVLHGPRLIEWLFVRRGGLNFWVKAGFIFLGIGWFWMLLISVMSRHEEEGFITAICFALAMHWLFKFLCVMEAVRLPFEMARSGAWEMLLTTPLREKEIQWGLRRGFRTLFRSGARWLAGVNAVMFIWIFAFADQLRMRSEEHLVFGTFLVGGMLVLFSDLKAIQALSVRQGLMGRSYLKAAFAVIWRLFGAPWVVGPVLAVISLESREEAESLFVSGILWFSFVIVLNRILSARARHGLNRLWREQPG